MAKSSVFVLVLFFLCHLSHETFLVDNELENDGWRNNPRFNNNHDDEINLHHHHEDSPSSSESLMIQTNSGLVRGISQTIPTGETVNAFLGIPYAKPPLADLRFKRPIPIDPWLDVLEANRLPNSCQQEILGLTPGFRGDEMWNPNTPISEDCLYLNLWIPSESGSLTTTNNGPRTVLIWIHGGGYFSGTSTLEVYDGSILAGSNDVIVVSVNYRLGPFGFLYLGNEEAPGNVGLYDQTLAIEWVRENIAHFGGDPDSMTLFGESAGAGSVSLHLMSPVSRHLFKRAVLQSGSSNTPWNIMTAERATRLARNLIEDVGCDVNADPETIAECLRSADARNLSAAQSVRPVKFSGYMGPVVDGVFVVQDTDERIQNGNFSGYELLVSTNKDEGTYFIYYDYNQYCDKDQLFPMNQTAFLEAIDTLFENFPPLERQLIAHEYTDWNINFHENNNNGSILNMKALGDLYGDYLFTCPLNRFAQKFAEDGSSVYYYHFTQRSSQNPWGDWMGVLHGDEIEYVFGCPLNPVLNFSASEKDLSRRMMKYLVNFARTGKPMEDEESWPKYSLKEPNHLILNAGEEGDILGKVGPRAGPCSLWNEIIPSIKQNCKKPDDGELLRHVHHPWNE